MCLVFDTCWSWRLEKLDHCNTCYTVYGSTPVILQLHNFNRRTVDFDVFVLSVLGPVLNLGCIFNNKPLPLFRGVSEKHHGYHSYINWYEYSTSTYSIFGFKLVKFGLQNILNRTTQNPANVERTDRLLALLRVILSKKIDIKNKKSPRHGAIDSLVAYSGTGS